MIIYIVYILPQSTMETCNICCEEYNDTTNKKVKMSEKFIKPCIHECCSACYKNIKKVSRKEHDCVFRCPFCRKDYKSNDRVIKKIKLYNNYDNNKINNISYDINEININNNNINNLINSNLIDNIYLNNYMDYMDYINNLHYRRRGNIII